MDKTQAKETDRQTETEEETYMQFFSEQALLLTQDLGVTYGEPKRAVDIIRNALIPGHFLRIQRSLKGRINYAERMRELKQAGLDIDICPSSPYSYQVFDFTGDAGGQMHNLIIFQRSAASEASAA